MRWRIFDAEKKADGRQLTAQKREFYTEGSEDTEFTEKRKSKKGTMNRAPTRETRLVAREGSLWREAEGFVFCVDPDVDDFGFLAFFGFVVGDGHRRVRADGYADLDAGG